MSARRKLIAELSEDSLGGIATLQDVDRAEKLVDAYRAEVLAEAKTEVVGWLIKKAREHRAQGRQYAKQADVIGRLASKVDRGAVRVLWNPVPMEPNTRGFFQAGHTYSREHHGQTVMFVVTAVSASPGGDRTVAHGWRTDPYSDWEPTDSDDLTGWTDVTNEVAS